MTNKIEINPAQHEVNYSEGNLNIDDSDTTINIAIGWKVAAKITTDYVSELDDLEFENFIYEMRRKRNAK